MSRDLLPGRALGALLAAALLVTLLAPRGVAQETLEQRVERLEVENAELREQFLSLSDELERFELRDVIPTVGASFAGMGPAASKVYQVESGLSIGGYGEALYSASSDAPDRADFLRAIAYVGYKFTDRWVFNSELELEHADTGESGSAAVEFAYLDYLHSPALNVRTGLVLVPMGWLSEMHEPTTFLGGHRPETERRILPSTWRENGIGVYGALGGFDYKLYVVNGFDASGFTAGGLRGGRQKGSNALAEDVAVVARADWVDTPGLTVGGSLYVGDSGQGQAGLGDVSTTIFEVHGEYRAGPWSMRALAARAELGGVEALNASLGNTGSDSIGEELEGLYAELGYDVLPLLKGASEHSLVPFVRWEKIDTQAAVATGLSADPAYDDDILTFGFNYQPLDEIVFKLDYQDFDGGGDRLTLTMGYVF